MHFQSEKRPKSPQSRSRNSPQGTSRTLAATRKCSPDLDPHHFLAGAFERLLRGGPTVCTFGSGLFQLTSVRDRFVLLSGSVVHLFSWAAYYQIVARPEESINSGVDGRAAVLGNTGITLLAASLFMHVVALAKRFWRRYT